MIHDMMQIERKLTKCKNQNNGNLKLVQIPTTVI